MSNNLRALVFALLAAVPSLAQCSWLEFCEIEGEILEAAATSAKRTYALEVLVARATRTKVGSLSSYTDCSEYIGKPLAVSLRFPRKAGEPSVGDQVLFQRSVIDGFGSDGSFAGTGVSTEFLQLRKGRHENRAN